MDLFVLAHFFGWLIKAMVIRDWRLLWVLSILFEWMEITFRHILPNFWECWWDHVSVFKHQQILLIPIPALLAAVSAPSPVASVAF